ncbi:MAG: ABC transporter ATP-binding protein [Chloroflexi bacterium]|nr:ABC transporter ATP-binding protein [Chloroflexota bacterium]
MVSRAEPILIAEGLVRSFRRGPAAVQALRGVDLTLWPGQFVAIQGRSGSGKTTLLNIVGGLDRPDAGQVRFEGADLERLGDAELTRLRRHRFGFVFQAFSLLPSYSAYENVELALRLAGAPFRARRSRVEELLDLVGLADRARHRPFELSGGEQQRVAIARALANRPALVLADEPTGELDSATGAAILRLLRQIVAQEGVCVLMATHDPTVHALVDRRCVLIDGRLEGDPALSSGTEFA